MFLPSGDDLTLSGLVAGVNEFLSLVLVQGLQRRGCFSFCLGDDLTLPDRAGRINEFL